jgi:NAD(P)-dependent dehydrogenase (short-subunit alcohol dehydrogenase family)
MGAGSLQGKVAVVIGGHSGFGEAIVQRFVAEGAKVAIAARRVDVVREAAAAVGGKGYKCDITVDDDVAELVAAVERDFGRIDIAVNSAGYEQSTPIAELTPEKLLPMQAVQFTGALYCMRHFGNSMAASGGGSFLSISSQTAHSPTIGLAAYGSSKAGVEYATKIAAVEYGPKGVRFNCIAAGLIETPMTERIFKGAPAAIRALTELTPLRHTGTPEDIAKAAHYFCSDESSFVTGQTLSVDGGAVLHGLPTPFHYADAARRMAEEAAE